MASAAPVIPMTAPPPHRGRGFSFARCSCPRHHGHHQRTRTSAEHARSGRKNPARKALAPCCSWKIRCPPRAPARPESTQHRHRRCRPICLRGADPVAKKGPPADDKAPPQTRHVSAPDPHMSEAAGDDRSFPGRGMRIGRRRSPRAEWSAHDRAARPALHFGTGSGNFPGSRAIDPQTGSAPRSTQIPFPLCQRTSGMGCKHLRNWAFRKRPVS